MENASEFGYFAKDVATELEVTTSTLRRWSIDLEKAGYKFERNEKEQRIYYNRDFKAFRELKKLSSNNVPLSDAIKAVSSMSIEDLNAQKTPSVYTQETRLSKRDIEEILDTKINEAISAAFEEGRKQGREEAKEVLQKIEHRQDERDQKLMSVIREIQKEKEQVKQLVAATVEEKEKEKETEKKGFWQKLFGL